MNAAAQESARLRGGEESLRYVTAGLLRALVQEEHAPSGTLREQALARLNEALEADLTCFLSITESEARLLGVSGEDKVTELLPREPFPARRLGFLGGEAWLRSPYRIGPVSGELPQPKLLVGALDREVRAVVGAPILLAPGQTGVLCGLRTHPAPFSPEALELIERTAELLGTLWRRERGLAGHQSESTRLEHLAALTGCSQTALEEPAHAGLLEAIGAANLLRYQVVPLEDLGTGRIRAAVADPLDWRAQADFEAVTSYRIAERCVAAPERIRERLTKDFEALETRDAPDPLRDLAESLIDPPLPTDAPDEESPPIVRLAHQLVAEAHAVKASDIHIEAHEDRVVIRFRVDGVCRERLVLPQRVARPLVARLKVMSDLNIAEHRLPQDGRLAFARFDPSLDLDIRVSVMPMLHGECVVLRLLDRNTAQLELAALGFSEHNLAEYRRAVRSPFGMILHCGPTGSGKSTTLYAALRELNDPQWKIVTAEDPIEYTLDGVNQLQVHPQIGLTFAAALRCFLRHDPDVILVGEIRDSETARIAVEASLTGHLLLSTLHTNDAATSVARLGRLGIEPLLLASTLLAVCAQRLLRRVCSCGATQEPDAQALALLRRARDGKPPGLIPLPVGCERCHHSGYKGRTGIHELMIVNARLRQHIADGTSAEQLQLVARKQGMRTLFEDAMAKVNAGDTSLDEALRVCRPDELG